MKKKYWRKIIWSFYLIMIVVFVSLSTEVIQAQTPVEDKIGVLITGWGMSSGYNHHYAWTSSDYPRIGGDITEVEGEPCKIGHVGEFPYQSHIGMIPWAVTFLTEGMEEFYDYTGIYIFEDGIYKSPSPEHYPDVTLAEIPLNTPITPLVDVVSRGVQSYPPDPRDGTDPLAGWFLIGSWTNPFPNGAGDMTEGGPPFYVRLYNILGQPSDPQDRLQRNPYDLEQEEHLEVLMDAAFGDRIDLRYGWYTAIKDDNGINYSKLMDDVAEEFANEGFTKLLLSRETTDFNNYALEFMTGNYCKERLCELGALDNTEIHMNRQIGRTPEYNTMVTRNITPYIEAYPEGSTIAIIYTTRGLTWGKEETTGNFGSPHPWSKEVYHENAYLNYLSLKEALKKEFGQRYNLVFTEGGIDSDNRTDNFYTYALGNDVDLKGYGGETVFSNIRDEVQRAKDDGIDKIIVVPGHWNSDNLDTILRMKEINSFPVLPKADLEAGIFAMTHCEPFGTWDAENEDWVGLDPVECDAPEAVTEITVAPSFSHSIVEFATSYYVVLQGNLEKFGLYPYGEEPAIAVLQPVTKLLGGTVAVDNATSPIDGASIAIPADPYPTYPEDFTWEDGLENTARPIDDPANTNDSMWEDTVIRIGHRSTPRAMVNAQAVGPAVHFGPYRTFFNRNVILTIPYDSGTTQGQQIYPYIYNHLTETWDKLQPDIASNGLLSFKTKVLGLFRAGTDGTDDIDDDGVLNDFDECESTPVNVIVDPLGCSIEQLVPCEGPRESAKSWRNHGKYVAALTKVLKRFVSQGLITKREIRAFMKEKASSGCGK